MRTAKTKDERKSERLKRKEERQNTLTTLALMKGKHIKKDMTDKERVELLIVVCDLLVISKKGVVQ